MRVFQKQKIDPVLVDKKTAAELLSLDEAAIDQLIEDGDLRVARQVGDVSLIAYRQLLVFAGIAKWYFREVVDV